MKKCVDLYWLSTIACKIADCLTEDELAVLAIELTALGDLLAVIATKQAICNKEKEHSTSVECGSSCYKI